MGKACELLFALVREGRFALTKQTACDLHARVAKEEALTWGAFRTKPVTIAGTRHTPPPAESLDALFESGRAHLEDLPDPTERALAVFLFTAYSQFFFDGNKCTGRLLMNGLLLSEGFFALTVPPEHLLAFNEKMIAFCDSADATEMMAFLAGLGGESPQ
jgi:Fic family protein